MQDKLKKCKASMCYSYDSTSKCTKLFREHPEEFTKATDITMNWNEDYTKVFFTYYLFDIYFENVLFYIVTF